ncbi:MAG: sigma-54-dependent Fis family transcriptional regulator [Gammaproteobacteria bacterium]|nr:sigma-54-dependent Fis family transcriptional regulator [Gammaproteobacteria bacterium]NIR81898.1 sigma-54-dependent Fis family transcriptional regulator [Gammaproteobacteria bacterium]NIR88730.1 sigma-54-dependent Fis family transcriptional regulator [Gammaproteobacteria bacterium]NIU03006.1 sigma-54-dependent Fis family transcriptional regulator [Gammaproteobacteria bacterium]NIV50527.1 response regulator [Gammaproteobacteria bacterium]
MGFAKKRERTSALPSLLLVDDDPLIGESLHFVLRGEFDVHLATTREQARSQVLRMNELPALALVDLGLPPEPHAPDEGFALIEELLSINPSIKILVLSGQSDRANIQHALSLGAVDFIPKPCDVNLLKARLHHQLLILDAEKHDRPEQEHDVRMFGESPAMRTLWTQTERFADTPFPVLVQGESGTGKELVAQLLHERSTLAAEPFLTVNCAAFTPELLEAQLFGHAKGAFTGASTARSGFFEEAGRGTLFLDEIGEFPVELQPKLLRVLENGQYYRVGETRPRTAQARIIAASNRDLLEEIRGGRFRHDLYHRLSVLTITVPPLRERGDDTLRLLDYFRSLYAAKIAPFVLDEEAKGRWSRYPFPGNVRELRNIVIRLSAKYPGQRVGITELEAELDSQSEVDADTIEQLKGGRFRLDEILNAWEQRYIDAALKLSQGNLSEAARLLGVNRTTLYSKIQRLSGEKS